METKSKMATKTKTKTKTDEAPREHKKPWQETFATPEEIKAMVSNHVLLRYNEVRGLTEVHWLSEGPVILQMSGGVNMRELSTAVLGRALTAMGFESKLIHGVRRYRVVRRTEAEKELHRHLQEMGGEGGEVE